MVSARPEHSSHGVVWNRRTDGPLAVVPLSDKRASPVLSLNQHLGSGGAACTKNSQCASSVCGNKKCLAEAGATCSKNSDCASNTCDKGKCVLPVGASCAQAKFATLCISTAICTNGTCLLPPGSRCITNLSCSSSYCQNSVCKIRVKANCAAYPNQCGSGRSCTSGNVCLGDNGSRAFGSDPTTCQSGHCTPTVGSKVEGCICSPAAAPAPPPSGLPLGASCKAPNTNKCASPLVCDSSTFTCQAAKSGPSRTGDTCPSRTGDTCTDDSKCLSGLCSGGSCFTTDSGLIPVDGRCLGDGDCSKPNFCNDASKCAEPSTSGMCSVDAHCRSGLCSKGMCIGTNSNAVVNGDHCLADGDCASGLCSDPGTGKVCRAINSGHVLVNAHCLADGDCASSLWSDSGNGKACSAVNSGHIPAGAHCLADVDCAINNFCNAGHVCAAGSPVGTTCTMDAQCSSGLCSNNTCTSINKKSVRPGNHCLANLDSASRQPACSGQICHVLVTYLQFNPYCDDIYLGEAYISNITTSE